MTRRSSPPALPPQAARHSGWLLLFLLAITAAAYQPAWHGGVLWDDDRHLTKAALQPAEGLRRIWFEPGATQQYYPLTHSAFWVMHRLWGDDTLGYHLVNIVLHAVSALLVALIVRRLELPGGVLAAVVFAVHPVHVESVAWMTELKNTLSGVLYFGAALAYLCFDADRRRGAYMVALSLFVLALLAKTVTATLPPALLVVIWWKRGRIEWPREVRPLVPFFAAAVAAGLTTVWVERTLIGAQGAEFALGAVERGLVAGRAIVFYLGKLLWPANLAFVYPRWHIDAGVWWQYLFLAGVVSLVAALWIIRRRARAPLAAFLLFCGTLVPVLGFFDVYPFRFSFVADHFQYLASVPIIVLAAAAAARTMGSPKGLDYGRTATLSRNAALRSPRRPNHERGVIGRSPALQGCLVAALGALLGSLTYAQSRNYRDAETLYRAALERNPSAWMAHVNLGLLQLNTRPGEAAAHFRAALAVKPDLAEAHSNLGMVLHRAGSVQQALAEYREAVRLDPGLAQAHANLCAALNQIGHSADAAEACGQALRLHYEYPEAHYNLGVAAHALGRPEAETHFREALRLNPGLAEAHNDLAAQLVTAARYQEAVAHFREAIRIRPDYADAHFNLANVLQNIGQLEDAVIYYRNALAHKPRDGAALNNLGVALERLGRVDAARAAYRAALEFHPGSEQARENVRRIENRSGKPK